MKTVIINIYNKLVILKNRFLIKILSLPQVKNTDETIQKIVNSKCSVSRFGDGEFGIMDGHSLLFQPYSKKLELKLREIIRSELDSHIVCIPDVFNGLDRFSEDSKSFWRIYLDFNLSKIYNKIDRSKQYYDTQVTRLYMDIKDKSLARDRFLSLKEIWCKKDIVIVEGEKSRLGIGNDLFSDSKSIKRIICPSVDSFSKYDEIIDEIKKVDKSKLILLALGPTATVLAYDLSLIGYQAIDIGHIDIEYEWYLKGVIKKCPIKNKYMGEVAGGTEVENINDIKYKSEVISYIL